MGHSSCTLIIIESLWFLTISLLLLELDCEWLPVSEIREAKGINL